MRAHRRGQDLQSDWLAALMCALRDEDERSVWLFMDDNQRVYDARLEVPGEFRPFDLTVNCRNTQAFHDEVMKLYRGAAKPEMRGPPGRAPELVITDDQAGAVAGFLDELCGKHAELQGVFIARRQQHAAEAAKWRGELGRATAPIIAQTLPPHTGWLTLDDVCAFAGIEREEADAGCDVLAASDILRRDSVWVEAVSQDVPIVRRTAKGTLDSEPLRAWLESVVAERFDDNVVEAAACLQTSEGFLRRVLEGNCDRVLLQAADWLFVRAGDPHQLELLYPADNDAAEPTA